jgi:AraC-like DNA-binding protein
MESIYHHLLRDAVTFVRPELRTIDLTVARVAHEIWGGNTTLYRDHNPVVVFFQVLSGRGNFTVNHRQTIDLEAGVFGIFGPDKHVKIEVGASNKLEVIIVRLTVTDFSWIRKLFGAYCGAYRVRSASQLQTFFRELFREAREGGPYVREICDEWMRLILLKASATLQQKKTPHQRLERTFFKLRRELHLRFREIQTIKELSQSTGYTAEHIGRLFQKFEKTGAYNYLLSLKINTAAEELLSSHATIEEIAMRVGFEDPYSFSRAFKRIMGRPPSSYRKS